MRRWCRWCCVRCPTRALRWRRSGGRCVPAQSCGFMSTSVRGGPGLLGCSRCSIRDGPASRGAATPTPTATPSRRSAVLGSRSGTSTGSASVPGSSPHRCRMSWAVLTECDGLLHRSWRGAMITSVRPPEAEAPGASHRGLCPHPPDAAMQVSTNVPSMPWELVADTHTGERVLTLTGGAEATPRRCVSMPVRQACAGGVAHRAGDTR